MKTPPTRPHQSASFARSKAVPRLRGRFAFAVLTALALLGLTDRVAAQGTVPERMSFQGFMEDASAVPLGQSAPVNLPVVFRIFPVATGGTASWAESQNVTFDKGNYSVLLGQGAVVGAEPHGDLSALVRTNSGNLLYVETTVTLNGTPTRISPRLRLVASPYALLATRALAADSADSATTAASAAALSGTVNASQLTGTILSNQLANSAVTTAKIADGSITPPKIAADAVGTAKIADGAVTSVKIASLDASKITGILSDDRLSGNVAMRNEANTFTGNQTINGAATITGNARINGNLTVTNSLTLGSLGQDKVTAGTETLRILRGQVRVTGSGGTTPEVVMGSGFTVTANTTYRPPGFGQINSVTELRFTTPFAQPPVVTVTLVSPQAAAGDTSINYFSWARVEYVTTTNAVLSFYHPANGGWLLPSPFMFTAVGPR